MAFREFLDGTLSIHKFESNFSVKKKIHRCLICTHVTRNDTNLGDFWAEFLPFQARLIDPPPRMQRALVVYRIVSMASG